MERLLYFKALASMHKQGVVHGHGKPGNFLFTFKVNKGYLIDLYLEKYLQEAWPIIKCALEEHGIVCELNLVEGSMTVSTTRKTRDPYNIVKARDLLKLLS
ncbi:hypothetical protein M5K25_013519 [Dendrobium thyrsiflorum]|uniref:KRR-R motif-containing protein 1 n=1 Tax=Dendrobium thyrsiflorum TaxID=117978 RepID=A0ABD0UT85_DENTH